MKKIMLKLAVILLIPGVTFAAGIQGEVLKIRDNRVVVEVIGDGTSGLPAGTHVRLNVIPKNKPTLDMLKG
mgnify:CR=1 FL=1